MLQEQAMQQAMLQQLYEQLEQSEASREQKVASLTADVDERCRQLEAAKQEAATMSADEFF